MTMAMATENRRPIGYQWRSSKFLIIACIAVALFTGSHLSHMILSIEQTIESRLMEFRKFLVQLHRPYS